MNDMLAAFYLVHHFELMHEEKELYREFQPEKRYSVALGLFRRLRQGKQERQDAGK